MKTATINSVQTRCVVKRRGSEKSTFLAIFWGVFDFLRVVCSLGIPQEKPLNLIKSPIFTNTPCKSTCLYNAPSMHTVDTSKELSDGFVEITKTTRESGVQTRGSPNNRFGNTRQHCQRIAIATVSTKNQSTEWS